VTPKPPSAGRGSASTISEEDRQVFKAMDNTVKILGQQPISPRDYDQRYDQTFRQQLKAAGLTDEAVERHAGNPKAKEFAQNLQRGLAQIKKNPAVKEKVRTWLKQTYNKMRPEDIDKLVDGVR
jgi:hypothetical protein